jgi:hypothetical protein
MTKRMLVFAGFTSEIWDSYPEGLSLNKMSTSLQNERRTLKYGIDLEYKVGVCAKMSAGILAATKAALCDGLVTQLGVLPLASFEVLADLVSQGCEEHPDWIEEFQMNVLSSAESLATVIATLEWLKRDLEASFASGNSSSQVATQLSQAIKTVEWLRSLYAFAGQQGMNVTIVLR